MPKKKTPSLGLPAKDNLAKASKKTLTSTKGLPGAKVRKSQTPKIDKSLGK